LQSASTTQEVGENLKIPQEETSMKNIFTILAVLLVAAGLVTPANAATDCTFTTVGTTMTLNASCTTDATIYIPDGFTLDGAGYTITAHDPAGGHFVGGVLKNAGAVAHVTNVTVTVSGLQNACDGGDARLAGIWLQDASGSVTNSAVVNINQGQSGCQEGNAIQVRSAPYDGTHPATKTVTVSGNTVSGYQKTGLLANGDVFLDAYNNQITGLGPVPFIAQNGLQLGYGAMGSIHDNVISGNYYSGSGWTSAGILAFDINASDNKIFRNDFGDNQRKFDQVEDSACPNMLGGVYSDWGLCQ
jgi:hypothetical protein